MSLRIRECAVDPGTLQAYSRLMTACFPDAPPMTVAYLQWLYAENPNGPVMGFDAWAGDQLVAHYACVPKRAAVQGQIVPALLSLNTATHPSHQGQGLFKRLACQTYETAAAQGLACVMGVANAQSTPGFIRSLGFQSVSALQARLGWGFPNWACPGPSLHTAVTGAAFSRRVQFAPIWEPRTLAWRARSPRNRVFPLHAGHTAGVSWWVARARAGIQVFAPPPAMEASEPRSPQPSCAGPTRQPLGLKLFLGLEPPGTWTWPVSGPIPMALRPSPLNFIYRALGSDGPAQLDPTAVSFSFLDFDAY